MKAAIIGFATEGVTSAAHWAAKGYEITVCDQNESLDVPEAYTKQLGNSYLDNLDAFDVIVRTAGLPPKLILQKNPTVAEKITTSVQEFFRVSPSKNLFGITGTKGKGTTTTLIAKMLEAAGKKVHIGGNIGIAALDLLTHIQPDDYVVLELSSFQLEDFKGPSPRVAVCVMVVPEHLNWHATMEEYLAAKSNLFRYQTTTDIAVYNALSPNSASIAGHSPGTKIGYEVQPDETGPTHTDGAYVRGTQIFYKDQAICSTEEVALLGRHNLENACAAITAVWDEINGNIPAITAVLQSFKGLEHRLELVRDLDGVRYYDDSFATTPETSIAAIKAFEQPKVMILGGSDKGVPLDALADEVAKSNIRHAVLIGDMAPVIANLLQIRGFTNFSTGPTTMPDIVKAARRSAQPGDVVLLSTGCASFGLFKDYKDRGDQFKQAVSSLA